MEACRKWLPWRQHPLMLALIAVSSLVQGYEDYGNDTDIGFDGIPPEPGLDNVILNKYFQWYFPLAARLGRWFEERGGEEGHIYTAHSYVASLYMNCPPGMGLQCPSDADKAVFADAVSRGHITWTALPWNGQAELMDPLSLASATHVTKYLDADMGVPQKTVVSQDVRAISVGVNSGSAPPDVPMNTPFLWRDPTSGAQLVAFWHPFGYGGHMFTDAGARMQLTPAQDCVKTPRRADGSRDVLCFSWRGDNSGPHGDPDDVLAVFAAARAQFPGARLRASTFEAFVDALEPFKAQLPVVEAEIGDTWIYGVASDPVKMARYRAIMRMRSKCLLEESCTAQDPHFRNFTRLLLKIPEHTWGIDSKRAPAAWDVWSNDAVAAALRDNPDFALAEHSWLRQLQYIEWGVEALAQSDVHGGLAGDLRTVLATQEAVPPRLAALHAGDARLRRCTVPADASTRRARRESAALRGLQAAEVPVRGDDSAGVIAGRADCGEEHWELKTRSWHVKVNGTSGDIVSLRRLWGDGSGGVVPGTDWAAGGAFGAVVYNTYSEAFFREWDAAYNPGGAAAFTGNWAYDFGKPGADSAGVGDRTARPTFVGAEASDGPSAGEQVLMMHYAFDGWAVRRAGAPRNVTLFLRTWPGSSHVMFDLVWEDKQRTRLPEALWLRFQPSADAAALDQMKLWKVGSLMSPLEVVRNGSHNLHAVGDGGVHIPSAVSAWEELQVTTLDAPLVAVGPPSPLPDLTGPARVADGFSVCLVNNVWGTNYVMWTPYADGVGAQVKMRFILTVRDRRQPAEPAWHLSFDPHFSDLHPHDLL